MTQPMAATLLALHLVTLHLVVLHNGDGRTIIINPQAVTSMREARPDDDPDRMFAKRLACMISLSDGKFVAVIETCETARHMIDDAK